MSSVANIAALKALLADNLPDDLLVFVESVLDSFQLRRSSALTDDGITVVAPTVGSGRWLRQNIAHATRIAQTTWHIDPVAGNDENDGLTQGTSLLTGDEMRRRRGSFQGRVTSLVDVYLHGSVRLALFEWIGTGGRIFVHGDRTIVNVNGQTTGIVTVVQQQVATTDTELLITATDNGGAPAAIDFSTLVGKFVKVLTGSAAGGYFVVRSAPALGQAKITTPLAPNASLVAIVPTIKTVLAGDTFEVFDVSVVLGGSQISIQAEPIKTAEVNVPGVRVALEFVELGESTQRLQIQCSNSLIVVYCRSCRITRGAVAVGYHYYENCDAFGSWYMAYVAGAIWGGVTRSTDTWVIRSATVGLQIQYDHHLDATYGIRAAGSSDSAQVDIQSMAIHTTTDGMQLYRQSWASFFPGVAGGSSGLLWGKCTTAGAYPINVTAGGRFLTTDPSKYVATGGTANEDFSVGGTKFAVADLVAGLRSFRHPVNGAEFVNENAAAGSIATNAENETTRTTAVSLTVKTSDAVIVCTANNLTITLPAAPVLGSKYTVVADNAATALLPTVVGRNGKNINNQAADATIAIPFGRMTFTYDGTQWVAEYPPGETVVFRVAFVAGAGGVPDDVTLVSVSSFKFRVVESKILVSTAIGASTATLRDTAGGGGTALSDAWSTAGTGTVRDTALTATGMIAAGGSLYLRRSDRGVAGEVVILAQRTG